MFQDLWSVVTFDMFPIYKINFFLPVSKQGRQICASFDEEEQVPGCSCSTIQVSTGKKILILCK